MNLLSHEWYRITTERQKWLGEWVCHSYFARPSLYIIAAEIFIKVHLIASVIIFQFLNKFIHSETHHPITRALILETSFIRSFSWCKNQITSINAPTNLWLLSTYWSFLFLFVFAADNFLDKRELTYFNYERKMELRLTSCVYF